jgi:hypothetical protein
MAKQKPYALENAKRRLKRMEDLIGPYSQDVTPSQIPNRGAWIPSDHLGFAPDVVEIEKAISALPR